MGETLQMRVPFGRKQYVVEELSQEGIKEGCREQPCTNGARFECIYPVSASILADVLAKLSCDPFKLVQVMRIEDPKVKYCQIKSSHTKI